MITSGQEWDVLKDIWEAERRPGYVMRGSAMYQVFTPNGPEAVQFLLVDGNSLYSGTSTGAAKAEIGGKKSGQKR